MRILVCGSRTWTNHETIESALRPFTDNQPNTTVIHGGAKGADTLAGNIAYRIGFLVEEFPADWKRYGKAAGMIRNQQMLVEGKPNIVLAFQIGDSRGTQNMIDIARKAGIEVRVYKG